MKLSILSASLLLGSATAKHNKVFGRSMHKRSAVKKTIHQYGVSAAKKVSDPHLWAKTPKASVDESADVPTVDAKASHRSKSSKVTESVDTPSVTESKTAKRSKRAADDDRFVLTSSSKSAKKTRAADDRVVFTSSSKTAKVGHSMSYAYGGGMGDYDPSFSMPFSFDYSMPAVESTTTLPPPTTTTETPPSDDSSGSGDGSSDEEEQDWGKLIFEYVSQCTGGIPLNMDSCLVSKTIDAFNSNLPNDCGTNGRIRHLQASAGSRFVASPNGGLRFLGKEAEVEEENCCAPRVNEQDLRPIMEVAKQECIDAGVEVTDEFFLQVLYTFMRQFGNRECWTALCSEGANPSQLFFELLFGNAARCAGVNDLERLPGCAMDSIVKVVLSVDSSEEEDSDPCSQPTEDDYDIFAVLLLLDAKSTCANEGIRLEESEWDSVHDDLVTTFSANTCWGIDDCEEPVPVVEVINLADPQDDEEEDPFVTPSGDGHQCVFDASPDSSRPLELPFFYRVETVSGAPDLGAIERALIETVCDDASTERVRVLVGTQETNIVAVDSSPKDTIDDFCTPENAKAANCYIIDGAVTLILEGASKEDDEGLKLGAYSRLEELFDYLPQTLDDPNIVDIVYFGTSPPAITTSDAPVDDEPKDDSTIIANQATTQDEEALNAVWLAIGGGLVAVAMLITGFHRMNQQKEAEDSVSPDEKSNDGQSTAYHTADLTIAATGSDLSSIASPTRSLDSSGLPPTPSPAKFFILAESEEQNWRNLSILPALEQDDGTLEGVSEEDEFIGTVRSNSESSGEISV